MPRQRKPQSGVARAAGRVANTTTSWRDIAVTNAKVYRIPTGGSRTECPAPLIEVGWVSPISVRKEWNVYYVSLPTENLKSVIEWLSDLDLSNVTVSMSTVDGPLTVNGSITSDWTIIWEAVQANTLTATTWNITNLTAGDVTATTVDTNAITTVTLQTSWDATVGWNLEVVGATTLDSTLSVTWNVTAGSDLSVSWVTTTGTLTATNWNITNLTSTDITADTITANTSIASNGTLSV